MAVALSGRDAQSCNAAAWAAAKARQWRQALALHCDWLGKSFVSELCAQSGHLKPLPRLLKALEPPFEALRSSF